MRPVGVLPLESPREVALQQLRNAVLSGASQGQIHRFETYAFFAGCSFKETDSLICSATQALLAKRKAKALSVA